jgi:Ca2+-binding RTX toxin-like protein
MLGADNIKVDLVGADGVACSTSFALGAGAVTGILLGAGALSCTGNEAANSLYAGSGGSTLDGAGGNDLLIGGTGQDIFWITRGGGSDTVADLTAADVVRLDGYGFSDFASLQATMSQLGSDVLVALGGGETLTITGHAIADLTPSEFAFSGSAPAPGGIAGPDAFALPASAAPTGFFSRTAADHLSGLAGSDQLAAGGGADTMAGDPGWWH